MKKWYTALLLGFMLISIASTSDASSKPYPVARQGKTAAGIFENGKRIVTATNTNEVYPIQQAVKVKDTLFFTEFKSGSYHPGCGGMDTIYSLKMKQGKERVRTLSDTIDRVTSRMTTDGHALYYLAVSGFKMNDAIQLSSDGKKRTVLARSVDDMWYAVGYLYYVKEHQVYQYDLKNKKSKKISTSRMLVHSSGACSSPTYQPTPSGIVFEDTLFTSTKHFYSYSTRKNTLFSVMLKENDDPTILDIDLKKKQYLASSIEFGRSYLHLRSFDGKMKKTIFAFSNPSRSTFTSTPLFLPESVSLKQRSFAYVSGTQKKSVTF